MKSFYKNLLSFLIIMMIFIMSSCVGKVKDATPLQVLAQTATDLAVINYVGIISAQAISNTKVEVFFPPIDSDPDNVAYIISYDRQENPLYVNASTLKSDYRGYLKYTVENLNSDTAYVFNVQAKNNITGNISVNNLKYSTKTFSNETANFYGISEVRNLSGGSGLNGIEVLWPEAENKQLGSNSNPIDPIEYKITIIDSNFLNPGNMNDATFSEPQRRVVSVSNSKRSTIINGLKSGTKYFVQVRCIHFAYTANAINSSYKIEENTNYLQISTYSDDLANLNFKNTSFFLTSPSGDGGLYAITANWEAPVGNFDHYRIYYSVAGSINLTTFLNTSDVDAVCMDQEISDSRVSCQVADSSRSSTYLSGLLPNTNYEAIIAVCLSADCIRSKRLISQSRTRLTTPALVNFQGISTINTSLNINELDSLILNLSPLDFSIGNISGILVDYYGNSESNSSPITINDPSIPNTSGLTVDPFDYRSSSEMHIVVRGIDASVVDKQCFLVYPFTYNSDNSKHLYQNLSTPLCIIPSLKGPTSQMFPGFITDSVNSPCNKLSHQIDVSWLTPSNGIYSKYEIFYTNSPLPFSFSSALDYLSGNGYHRVLVDGSVNSYSLTNLETGPTVNYQVGILTYYNSINGNIRSDNNVGIINCNNM